MSALPDLHVEDGPQTHRLHVELTSNSTMHYCPVFELDGDSLIVELHQKPAAAAAEESVSVVCSRLADRCTDSSTSYGRDDPCLAKGPPACLWLVS